MAVVRLETGDHQPENGFVSSETTSPALLSRIDGYVLPLLGGFGKYQIQLIVLTCIPVLFLGFSQFSDNFLLAQPNSTCVHPIAKVGNTTASSLSLFHNSNSGTTVPSVNGTSNDSTSIDCSCLEWNYKLQTGLVQNVVTKWNLVCNSEWKVHIAKFSLLVGSIFGYLVLGVLADWYGRQPVLITSVFFMVLFGLTVAFSINVTMFSTLRFFEGFCLAGITLSLYVLRIELCLPLWRFRVTMVANFVVLAGQLLMPGLAALCRDWQVLQAIIICPFILMVSYFWIFPESLRWLLSTQQYFRARRHMHRIARKNQVGETETDELFSEIQRESQKKPKKTCIVKMVGTRNLWKNIVVLCVNSLAGYGIHHCFARSMIDPEAGETSMFHNFHADYYTMAGIAVASCLALCPAVGFMGRRGGLLLFMIITALASLLQLGLLTLLGKYSLKLNIEREQSETLNKKFSIAFSIIGMFSSHAVSNLSIFFCAEITPTVIRGGGLGLVLASAGFGMLTAPIMELHNQKGYFLHHVIFACCTLICIICILLLPETRYKALPEHIGDGDAPPRPPLLGPKKPGEQDPLLNQPEPPDRPQEAEPGLSGSYAVEAPPSCVIELTPLRSTGAPPPFEVDVVCPVAVGNAHPKIADGSPPSTIDIMPSTPDPMAPSPPYTTGTTPTTPPVTAESTPTTPPDTAESTPTTPTTPPVTAEITQTIPPVTTESTLTTPPVTAEMTPTIPPVTTETTSTTPPVTAETTLTTAPLPPCSTCTTPPLPPVPTEATPVTPPVATDTTAISPNYTADTTSPCGTDATAPITTDTAPPCAKEESSPTTKDLKTPTATDPTTLTATDPKSPTATDSTTLTATDPKSPTATDPKSPTATDPATLTATGPKSPTATDSTTLTAADPKSPTATDSTTLTATDPKSPAATDPTTLTATDPKSPAATDPESPTATDPKSPTATDPKSPIATDPKSPTAIDPTTPNATDPKSPSAKDHKSPTATDPTTLTATGPKSPTATDPTAPTATDPKSPTATDPTTPTATDPTAPTAVDPKYPIATDPKSPTAIDPATPTATGPKSPSAAGPKSPTATDPKSPSAKDTVSPSAIAVVLPGATDSPAIGVIDAVTSPATDTALPCLTDATPGPASTPTTPPAYGTASANAAPPSPPTGTEGSIPANGTANGVRSS